MIVNGWSIYAHPLFLDQLNELVTTVESLQQKYPDCYQKKRPTKLLAAINKLAFEVIPQDPTKKEYRLGKTMGNDHKHWFRAKFFQQYRLFFRYHQQSRLIVYVWVNDEDSKRVYGSNKDAYKVFERMLNSGHPPNDWRELLTEVKEIK